MNKFTKEDIFYLLVTIFIALLAFNMGKQQCQSEPQTIQIRIVE